ncbi:MAG: carboxypeptidase regulatory-like domain-containing protein [Niabella sp.]
MTRYFYLITVLTFFSSGLLAQTGILKGTVKDSLTGVVLESATVTVLKKDSSLVNYQLTNGYGGFTINKLPLQTDLLLNITYAGFKSYNSIITIDSSILNINVILSPSFNDSNNVIVTAVIPIRMNGDTLEINPAAFKMDPNAVVEDLLTRVPGITV